MADKKVRVVPLVNGQLRVGILTEAKIHASVDISREDWKKFVADTADAIDAHDFEQERVADENAEQAERDAAERGEPKPKKHPVVIGSKKTASSPTGLLRRKAPADYMDRYNAMVRGESDAPFPPPEPAVIFQPAPVATTTPAQGEVPPPAVGAKSESASATPAGDVVPPGEKPKHAHAPKATKGTK